MQRAACSSAGAPGPSPEPNGSLPRPPQPSLYGNLGTKPSWVSSPLAGAPRQALPPQCAANMCGCSEPAGARGGDDAGGRPGRTSQRSSAALGGALVGGNPYPILATSLGFIHQVVGILDQF